MEVACSVWLYSSWTVQCPSFSVQSLQVINTSNGNTILRQVYIHFSRSSLQVKKLRIWSISLTLKSYIVHYRHTAAAWYLTVCLRISILKWTYSKFLTWKRGLLMSGLVIKFEGITLLFYLLLMTQAIMLTSQIEAVKLEQWYSIRTFAVNIIYRIIMIIIFLTMSKINHHLMASSVLLLQFCICSILTAVMFVG